MALSFMVYKYDSFLSLSILFVVTHFFLFCNVFRFSRPPELIWASVFVVLSIARMNIESVLGMHVMLICLALTVVLVILEIRKPGYHGILWWFFNPGLQSWFESKMQEKHQD